MLRFPHSLTSPWIHTMNRCRSIVLKCTTVFTLALCALPNIASAQLEANPLLVTRQFPARTKRGVMTITQPPELTLNGQTERLSPGARIHDANNMISMSGSLIGQKLLVNYVREPATGLVHEVWILTPAEAQLKTPSEMQKPVTLPAELSPQQ